MMILQYGNIYHDITYHDVMYVHNSLCIGHKQVCVYSVGFRGDSGGSIEPLFLGNSKFLQFIPSKNFMYNFEPVLHLPKLSEVVINILYIFTKV